MKKYGLQVRIQPSQQKKQSTRPPLCPAIFSTNDDDDDVNGEIARQATKKKVLKDVSKILDEFVFNIGSLLFFLGISFLSFCVYSYLLGRIFAYHSTFFFFVGRRAA